MNIRRSIRTVDRHQVKSGLQTLLLALLAGLSLPTQAAETDTSPQAIVEARMRALNAHDLDSFLSLYADDVRISVFPNTLLNTGKAGIAGIFGPLFEAADAEVTVDRIIAVDAFVVVERRFAYADTVEPGVAIYEVREGLIQSVTFLRDSTQAQRVPRDSAR